MGAISLWHWIILLIIFVGFGYPIARILGRLGYSRWWVIAAFITPINLIGLWVLAFVRWPVQGAGAN